ncbi:hypothetical protein ARMSODRAFT_957278 [Armillaria solidipes]|uniref:Uncharacterized protein n=1 Tax=Armillaria solidipes TaxID=1076256 RepID=A0A2H3BRJ2_9AGAR|nr:hypothetical protein ARMSODRAFT_957278 [Armillaria solidipes]
MITVGVACVEFMVSDELTKDICLDSDWYTFLLVSFGSADIFSGPCRFLHDLSIAALESSWSPIRAFRYF